MHYTFEMLVKGNAEVVDLYKKAVQRWKEIWLRKEAKDLAALARNLTGEQSWFEHNCGGRWVGQEIMVVSGFASLYSTAEGFGEYESRVRLLYDAFQSSLCSVEVKSIAGEVGESYDLMDSTTYY